jgi:hypothetical protein
MTACIGFYVSVLDGPRYALAAGPFKTHEEALALVDQVRGLCVRTEDDGVWWAYGTCKVTNEHRPLPVGRLNDKLGVEL